MNLNAIQPPLAIRASTPRFVCNFPGSSDQLWQADIRASRYGVQCREFEDILFVESNGTAFIYGIEFEDGYPKGLKPEIAQKQQAFIQFLREESRRDNDMLGITALFFDGHEYANEGKATAAYIAARDTGLLMGIGYSTEEGGYELIALDPTQGGWLESARAVLPFHELGV